LKSRESDSQSAVASSTSKTASGSDMEAGTKSIKRGNMGIEWKELSCDAGDETLSWQRD
jgi:hypothetical protein